MHKILLILEDYSELMFIQIVLKKLGFDVDGIQNPHALGERLLAFRPSVVIALEDGKRVRKETIAQPIMNAPGVKLIFLSSQAQGVELLSSGVARVRTPIQPADLINALDRLGQGDATSLLEKYKKMRRQLSSEKGGERILRELQSDDSGEQLGVSGYTEPTQSASMPSDTDAKIRRERNESFLKNAGDTVDQKFDPAAVAGLHKKLRSSERAEDIDRERKAFTVRLFDKKK